MDPIPGFPALPGGCGFLILIIVIAIAITIEEHSKK
jgi:hypothetical protein